LSRNPARNAGQNSCPYNSPQVGFLKGTGSNCVPTTITFACFGSGKDACMDIEILTSFFKWCTIMNVTLLILWTGTFMLMPDFVYRTQYKWFPVPRETFNVVMYSFLGLFKIMFLVFNVIPLVALLIVTS
jgi:hypothetical protein